MRIVSLAIIALTMSASLSFAEQSRYGSWQEEKDTAKTLASELKALVDEAEKARAADPRFIQDLKNLVNRYNNPWRVRVLEESFQDGDFKANPTWTVASGKFGMGWEGLISSVQPQQATAQQQPKKVSERDLAIALLGQVFNQAGGQSSSQQQATAPTYQPAEIYLKQSIPNGFAMTLDISGKAKEGGVDFVLYQGAQRSAGYRLNAVPGRGIRLLKVSSRGTATIANSAPTIQIADGKKHQLIWKRTTDGTMSLSLDGKTLFEQNDLSFRQAFDGFSLVNNGGEFTLHRLTIDGSP